MRVVVIGLGSMGKRRIRLLQRCRDVQDIYGVDSREDRRTEVEEVMGIRTFCCLEYLVPKEQIECAFVCASPLSHSSIIKECLAMKWNVFSEINLVSDGYADNIALAARESKVLFLSSTFLYREEIQYIKNMVYPHKKPVNYIYHTGQYLPDWHPWEKYNNFFVGDKRTSGCREIMAIEFPWIVNVFGDIESVSTFHNKISQLDIDYDDNYMIRVEHINGNKGIIMIDVVCPKAVRNLEAYSEDIYLTWDGTPTGMRKYNRRSGILENVKLYEKAEHLKDYQATIVENAYEKEIEDFFGVISGKKTQIYGFKEDYEILAWLDRIEEIK